VHTGLSGVTAEQRLLRAQRSSATAFNALQCAPESEHAQLVHRTVYRTCPVHHRTAQRPHKSELQRSNPNGSLTWLAHRTVSGGAPDSVRWCTGLSDAPCDCSLPTTIFGGWGYKYPQPPHIQLHLSFLTSTPYKSYSIHYKTH
jgi:hypothetical protein